MTESKSFKTKDQPVDLQVKVALWRVDAKDDKVETTLKWQDHIHSPTTNTKEINIYTHAQTDFRSCNVDSSIGLTSSIGGPTHLSRAIDALPTHNLHTRQTLGASAATLHDRITRDDGCEIMVIMAAIASRKNM
jgi:hypothetical protein